MARNKRRKPKPGKTKRKAVLSETMPRLRYDPGAKPQPRKS